jgi:glycosyltransferase involved in cell wall biosynthesis
MVGGYERAAERIAQGLVQKGHHVHVFTERRDFNWPAREHSGGVVIERYWCRYQPRWHTITSALSLALRLLPRGRSFDVWHLFQSGVSGGVSIALARLLRRPIVLRLASTNETGLAATVAGRRITPLLEALHRRVNGCQVGSRDMQTEALAFGIPATAVRLIPHAVDTGQFAPLDALGKARLRERLNLGAGVVAVYAGRLSWEKDPLALVEAWRTIAAERPDASLVMLGDGPLRGDVERAVEKYALGASVQCLGMREDVAEWLKAGDVFVLSSKLEGFSNALLEAMSSGLAVVSTRVSGTVDVFAHADVGELVDAGDTAELARATLRLIDDHPRREECGRRARELVLERYSQHKLIDRVEDFYTALLKGT